jgi:hypothetical protein
MPSLGSHKYIHRVESDMVKR